MAALRSGGSATLSSPGYLGTYVTIPAGGATVNFTINATEAAGSGANPHMNLVIADTVVPFNVSSTSATNYATGDISLPAGTYFLRNERDYAGNVGVSRAFTVNTVSVSTVSGSPATFSNTSNNTNALAAADTYINNFRKGSAAVALTGPGYVPLLGGTPVNVDLARHAFTFGTAIPGSTSSEVTSYLGTSGSAQQTNYQSRLNLNFNAIAPENAGKWKNNEATRDVVTMGGVDTMLNYAKARNQRARMHNLIWGDGSNNGSAPTWVLNDNAPPTDGLLDKAYLGDATAKNDLRAEITERIQSYVGTGSASDRSLKYGEIDVNNESWHRGPSPQAAPHNYWNVYGVNGLAGIHNEVASAIAASGSTAKVFLNEYNIFTNSKDLANAADPYANWYLQHAGQIRDAGGTVDGLGIQYYPNGSVGASDTQHTPSRITQVMQNLSVTGLPLTLTEFAIASGADPIVSADILQESVRLAFGTPQAGGFVMWGFQSENGGANLGAGSGAALYTLNTSDWNTWTITEAGKRWQDMLGIADWDGNPNNAWDTNVALVADANGTISLSGAFYGDYYLSGQGVGANNAKLLPFDLTLIKGTSSYAKSLAKPPSWFFWKTNGSGNWNIGGNWTDAPQSGGTPNTAGYTAYFGSSATTYDLGSGATAGNATTVNITNAVTATVSSTVTLGMLVFDNASSSYTINASGGGSIALAGFNNASGHAARIYLKSGNHTINAPLSPLDNTTITVIPALSTLTVAQLQPSAVSIIKDGAGAFVVNNLRAGPVAINAGTLRISADSGATGVSKLRELSIAGGAKLDLNINKLITTSTAGTWNGSTYDGITGLIASGRGDSALPLWDGSGIVTSQSNATGGNFASIGVARGSEVKANSISETALWAGQTITGTDTLVMYTYGGDANLDGKINIDDYVRIDNGIANAFAGWSNGDFNYDGKINIDDYSNVIDVNIGNQNGVFFTVSGDGPSNVSAIPEPASLTLLASALSGTACRRRRRINHIYHRRLS